MVMRHLVAVLLLLGIACTTTGCIIEGGDHGHGGCFWHHCR
jgi:hypothetical protein